MNNINLTIKKNNLIKSGEKIGVALSGGADSMALLDYLTKIQKDLGFEVLAIHVDHGIRENSVKDSKFVSEYCKNKSIRLYTFKINVRELAKERNESIETVARDARYKIFESLIEKEIVNKIALAHHAEDQAETILMHIFRGSGISGAKGMEVLSRDIYIRPMLNTRKKTILKYIKENSIPYVQDETNYEDTYQRNYLRNKIMPIVIERFPGAIDAINSFGKTCKEDDDYINTQINNEILLKESNKSIKIPCSYFLNETALSSRIIFKAINEVGIYKNIEKKHIEMIINLALNSENGRKIKLPMGLSVYKEYDYVTLTNETKNIKEINIPFKSGTYKFEGFGKIRISKTKEFQWNSEKLIIDATKLPKDAVWRYRKDGDFIKKINGGTQKLKTYFNQKKIPLRMRDFIPVLASGNEIFVVAGVDISEKVKVEDKNNKCYEIKVIK